MKHTTTSSLLERRLVVGLAVLLLVLVVWVVAARHWFQVVYLLAALVLALGATLLAAAWKQGFRWFFTRRALRFYAWLVVGLISVIVLFYTEESWRGKRAWAALQREAAAHGESLDIASITPPALSEAQNFAQAPGVASLLGYGSAPSEGAGHSNPFYHGTREQWPAGSWALQQATDLEAWQHFCRRHPSDPSRRTPPGVDRLFPTAAPAQAPAADVLLALSRFQTNLATLRAASPRPQTRFPIDYTQGFWAMDRPDQLAMEALYAAAHLLSLRASAELAQNQSQAALEDVLLGWRLADGLRQEPFYMAHDYRAQMAMFCLQPIWEGLAAHRWNASQLAVLQDRLGALDWVSDFRQPARGESLMLMDLADQFLAYQHHQPSLMKQQMVGNDRGERFGFWLVSVLYPTGWLYQDKAWIYRFYQQHDHPLKTASLDAAALSKRHSDFRRITDPAFLILVYPRLQHIFSELGEKAIFLHTACQEAQTACALER
ncbi:MAG TPA: hypothetical protein VNT26_20015, partial [Candidatus Sulfotelmatobacter sp.]|nr:hypothetical protein [Candidatus Sulfotelmatobacter sp.]